MRFLKDGPDIPDDLLIARDEGRVVFFCGAGVSRARAGLTDFFGLARRVTDELGVPDGHSVRKILEVAQEVGDRTGVGGLISADRVFGLLERDFLSTDIEQAVAQALKPSADVDLSTHQILLDLAKTPEGKVRIVTTNFDRLFEACSDDLRCFIPPRLPDPLRHDEMDGVIHLHGVTDAQYGGAEGDGFVLSSSEFGHAYLAEGWATDFIRKILDRYIIVFVGYAADDPPVHYLLEALNKKGGKLEGVFAFQAGELSEPIARWKDKGVTAIPYNDADDHKHLWQTMEEWAKRARDVDGWYDATLHQGMAGPAVVEPFKRGQIAHIASSLEGARRIADADKPLPAEWLCVFDPLRRFAKPSHTYDEMSRGAFVDPFDVYGLDRDPVPKKIDPDDHYAKRDVPSGVWDGFAATRIDLQGLHKISYPELRGSRAVHAPALPPRIQKLAAWISRVSSEPSAVWWAAHQIGLHPTAQGLIEHQLRNHKQGYSEIVSRAWEGLFEAWSKNQTDTDLDTYRIQDVLKKHGWSSSRLRVLCAALEPRATAGAGFWVGPRPPELADDLRMGQLIHFDVAYPHLPRDLDVPEEYLPLAVREFRRNLELAVQLEQEQGGYGLSLSNSIIPDERAGGGFGTVEGLFAHIKFYIKLFEKLIEIDVLAASRERKAWPRDDDKVFARLLIWSAGLSSLVNGEELVETFECLSASAFWDSYHQRDLLLVISQRWSELTKQQKVRIEDRLLEGVEEWPDESADEFAKRNASSILERLGWLHEHGCEFSFSFEEKEEEISGCLPDWESSYAEAAARSLGSRGGWVKTNTDHSLLESVPVNMILHEAAELSGRADDFLVENAPFNGLAKARPVRAFAALTDAARQNEFSQWAWTAFLNSSGRLADKTKFSALICERICRLSPEQIVSIAHPISSWFQGIAERLYAENSTAARKMFLKVVEAIAAHPDGADSSLVSSSEEMDWVSMAINAPVGKLAEALMDDPLIKELQDGGGFPDVWLSDVERLLNLPGTLGCHAYVIASFNLNWFYAKDAQWTEATILSKLNDAGDVSEAIWSGFYWGAQGPNQSLFMRMKDEFLTRAKEAAYRRRRHDEVLSAIILQGWGSINTQTGERYISNGECRDVLLSVDDEFRSQILWHIQRWSDDGENEGETAWSKLVPKFFAEVWPRQKFIRTSRISTRLCDLAFDSEDGFAEVVAAVLPHISKIESNDIFFPHLRKSKDTIAEKHPFEVLALLSAALPDDANKWPYGVDEVLERIGEVDADILQDERYLELMRIWNSR